MDADFNALYTIDSAIGVHSVVGPPGAGRLKAPGSMAVRPTDGELFVYNNVGTEGFRRQWGLVKLDRCTGFATRVGPATQAHVSMGAIAFAPDGRLYGFGRKHAHQSGYQVLFEIDPATGNYSEIGEVSRHAAYSVTAADFHPDGELYGIGTPQDIGDTGEQVLLIIDTATGQPSFVGELSPGAIHTSAMVFQPSGRILGAGVGSAGEKLLFEIDPATAVVTSIRRSTVAAQGMVFAPPARCPTRAE